MKRQNDGILKEDNPREVFPYGDTTNDGAVQLSFTLPVKTGALAKEAARRLILKMGFEKAEIVSMQDLGSNFTFFVAYGNTNLSVNTEAIDVVEVQFQHMSREECDDFIEKHIKRPLVVVGATIESDAHTVGLDAILNMKGYHGDFGLERYRMFEVYNMGSQVPCEELVKKLKAVNADAVLVSQIVTQKNIHIKNLTRLMELLEAENIRNDLITAVGGPRISHELALELGYDVGFGTGTVPSHVASYMATTLKDRMER